ncbi:MAG: galactokinase [Chloroflexi bacterium]|nr:galactokinase [Chloroflexota bacterium]
MPTPERVQAIADAFRRRYGVEPRIVRAPGRVNLIGEHTDYNDGFVLPVAIDRDVMIAFAPRGDRTVRLYSLNFAQESAFSLDRIELDRTAPWSNYVRGVAWSLQEKGATLCGVDAVIEGDVPVAAGLSSSAAIEVATARTFQALGGVSLTETQLALSCQRAENRFVGVNCGIMDQFISTLGRRGHALLIDCRSLEYRLVSLGGAPLRVVVADTTVRRGLVDSEYNARRSQCEQAVATLRQYLPGTTALRDVSLDDLARFRAALDTAAGPLVARRAEHVVGENARTVEGAAALERGDLARFGQLMNDSHRSLRDLYEVSCPELDALVEAAWSAEGVYGARMTGAGFGGCTVALVQPDAVPAFVEHVGRQYRRRTGRQAAVYDCEIVDGAGPVVPSPLAPLPTGRGDRNKGSP